VRRGGDIVLVAHCVLNANARVEGLAGYEGVHPLVAELAARGLGIVQLPCPEVSAEGCARPPRPREYYDTLAFRALCDEIVADTLVLVERYREAGTRVVLYVGVEGSPSCGVGMTNVTADEATGTTVRVPGCGVLACALREALASEGVVFAAVDGRDPDLGIARVMRAVPES
jgi:predicted secreted protein